MHQARSALALSLAAMVMLCTVPGHADSAADKLLRALNAASGGAAWDGMVAIAAEGRKTSFGLTGNYHSVEDLRSGRFAQRVEYAILANAEGLDQEGRWRMDNSRQVHPLDSGEAKTVAVTEAYLAKRGYLFDQGERIAPMILAPVVENRHIFDRVQVTPNGGRSVILWIGRNDRRLDRVVMQLSTVVRTIRYGDYRAVGGIILPFVIETADGDGSDTGTATISDYRLDRAVPEQALQRPSSTVVDASIRLRAPVTYAPFSLDQASGFPIVLASLNGKGPFPFILDTGGHDILTIAAASELGLSTLGQGFSQGAGADSTPTSFTQVNRLSLGDAELTRSPFLVLKLDLGRAPGLDGKPAQIEGIIGLEVFERFVMSLDFGAHRLTLARLDDFSPAGKTLAALPIRFTEDMPLIRASVNGRSGWFGVDTGNNTDPIIFSEWAMANGLTAQLEKAGAITGSSVGGSLELRRGQATALDVDGVHFGSLKILLAGENMGSLSSRSEAGNIGTKVLSRYKVTFDYRREMMYLKSASQ